MVIIADRLAAACRTAPERRGWLEALPPAIAELQDRWSLTLGPPWSHSEVSCAWVAPSRSSGIAHDATQHLLNCRTRRSDAPRETIHRVADLLEIDRERVRRWMFARVAADPRDKWIEDAVRMHPDARMAHATHRGAIAVTA